MNTLPPSSFRSSSAACIDEILFKSWWVFLFCLACFALYENGMQRQLRDYAALEEKLQILEVVRASELDTMEDLHLQVNSQSDYCWQELTLMKVLGLVPEGFTKVYFTQ